MAAGRAGAAARTAAQKRLLEQLQAHCRFQSIPQVLCPSKSRWFLILLSLIPDRIKLVFKDPIIIFLTGKLEFQNEHSPSGRAARSLVALSSAIGAFSTNLSALACIPSAILMSPMSSGSSPSTLQVEKTAMAPSI